MSLNYFVNLAQYKSIWKQRARHQVHCNIARRQNSSIADRRFTQNYSLAAIIRSRVLRLHLLVGNVVTAALAYDSGFRYCSLSREFNAGEVDWLLQTGRDLVRMISQLILSGNRREKTVRSRICTLERGRPLVKSVRARIVSCFSACEKQDWSKNVNMLLNSFRHRRMIYTNEDHANENNKRGTIFNFRYTNLEEDPLQRGK
jgi:hypothetical protein